MANELSNEKARIHTLFKNGQINAEDHQILIAALENRQRPLQKLLQFLSSPLQRMSTVSAWFAGVIAIAVMSFVGAKYKFNYYGALDFHIIREGQRTFSFTELLIQNGIDVVCVMIAFYVGAFLTKCKNLRFIDFGSSVILARFPYAFFALSIVVLDALFPGLPTTGKMPFRETFSVLVLAVVGIAFLTWQLALNFSALKESSGLKGQKLWFVFITGLVFAEACSYGLNSIVLG